MKFLAVLMACCTLFLSLAGIARPVEPSGKVFCCAKMTGKCGPQKEAAQRHGDSGCQSGTCAMLCLCPLCGFILPGQITLRPGSALYTQKPVTLYKAGGLSAYHPSNWKPPKTC